MIVIIICSKHFINVEILRTSGASGISLSHRHVTWEVPPTLVFGLHVCTVKVESDQIV